MDYGVTQDSARTWGGVERPPVGRVGRCPCQGHGYDVARKAIS